MSPGGPPLPLPPHFPRLWIVQNLNIACVPKLNNFESIIMKCLNLLKSFILCRGLLYKMFLTWISCPCVCCYKLNYLLQFRFWWKKRLISNTSHQNWRTTLNVSIFLCVRKNIKIFKLSLHHVQDRRVKTIIADLTRLCDFLGSKCANRPPNNQNFGVPFTQWAKRHGSFFYCSSSTLGFKVCICHVNCVWMRTKAYSSLVWEITD